MLMCERVCVCVCGEWRGGHAMLMCTWLVWERDQLNNCGPIGID